jgi:hypothetical protein
MAAAACLPRDQEGKEGDSSLFILRERRVVGFGGGGGGPAQDSFRKGWRTVLYGLIPSPATGLA